VWSEKIGGEKGAPGPMPGSATGWAVTFGTARRGHGRAVAPPTALLAVTNVTAHQRLLYQLHIIRRGTIIAIALDLKG